MTQVSLATSDDLPSFGPQLTEILWACVQDGASVGFVLPFSKEEALAYWEDRVFGGVRSGGTSLFIARAQGRVAGTVQLDHDLMPNQPHRANVAKMLVHPGFRRLGLGRAMMNALEIHARQLAKTLLVLDTRSGDPAQKLYQNLGFQIAGEIPGYCRNPFEDVYEPTTYLFKTLQ